MHSRNSRSDFGIRLGVLHQCDKVPAVQRRAAESEVNAATHRLAVGSGLALGSGLASLGVAEVAEAGLR